MVEQVQNFYKKTLQIACGAGAGNIYVGVKPTIANGYLVFSPSNTTLREIVKYTGTGTDATGDYVTIANASDRGLGGTTAQAHSVGESIRMNLTAEHWLEIINAISGFAPLNNPTFTGNVVVPDGDASNEAVNKGQLDTDLATKVGLTGDESIAGIKTFISAPQVPTPVGGNDAVNLTYLLGVVLGSVVVDQGFQNFNIRYDTIGRVESIYDGILQKTYFVKYRTDDIYTPYFIDSVDKFVVVGYNNDKSLLVGNKY